jgi:hypothetical protein
VIFLWSDSWLGIAMLLFEWFVLTGCEIGDMDKDYLFFLCGLAGWCNLGLGLLVPGSGVSFCCTRTEIDIGRKWANFEMKL